MLRVRRAYQSHLADLLGQYYRSLLGQGLDPDDARREVRKLLTDWSETLKHSGIPRAWRSPEQRGSESPERSERSA